MNLEFIKYQMNFADVNALYLHKLTKVGYATINDLLNGKRQLDTLQAKNYIRLVDALFTKTEQAIIDSSRDVEDYKNKHKELIKYALNQSDCEVDLSGGVDYNSKNEPLSMPSHIKLEWSIFELRIYDEELYRTLINNKGQRHKKKEVEEWIKKER